MSCFQRHVRFEQMHMHIAKVSFASDADRVLAPCLCNRRRVGSRMLSPSQVDEDIHARNAVPHYQYLHVENKATSFFAGEDGRCIDGQPQIMILAS